MENLKKWLCGELGFSRRYFERFVQRGYDSIDLVIQLREDDLQRIGISSRKERMKLLEEFGRFHHFQSSALGAFI